MKQMLMIGSVAFALSAAPAFAQTTPVQPKAQTPAPQHDMAMKGPADQHFMKEAAIGGMAEVELGRMAAEKAQASEVKQFGQKMVDDHGKANDELKSLAKDKNVMLPTEIDAKHKAVADRLSKLSGDAFDRAYMQAMLKDHREDVAAFRTESKSGKDSEVKSWAAKTLPTLEQHLKMAEDANRAVGTSGKK
jgi:putative membrane protein